MDGTASERFENRGPAPGSSGDHNAVVGGALAESKLLHTEHVHRREGALRVELPLVDLGEVRSSSASVAQDLRTSSRVQAMRSSSFTTVIAGFVSIMP